MLQFFYSAAETLAPAAEQIPSAPPSLFITIVASAFGGALITSGVTIWAKFADSKAEHRKWLREEKYKTYVDAQVIFQGVKDTKHMSNLLAKDATALVTKTHSMFSRMELLAPKSVRDAVRNARSKMTIEDDESKRQEMSLSISALLRAMRADILGSKLEKKDS